MIENQICPNCRSTFEISGRLDFSAPSLQTIYCPVDNQAIWKASGLIPQRWSVGKIIDYVTPVSQPIPVTAPTDDSPVWSHFEIPFQNQLGSLGQGLYKIGLWVVIVLVLVAVIKIKK